jgi:hypothetical protein
VAFTYHLTSDDETERLISEVRLELGDTVEGDGVLPDGGNFSDAEISHYLSQYDNSVAQVVAKLAGVLVSRWSSVVDVSVGPRSESLSQVAAQWAKRAETLQATAGSGSAIGYFGVARARRR